MKMVKCFVALMILAQCFPGAVSGDGMIIIDRPPPIIPPRPRTYDFAPLEVKYHHVTAKIRDQVAETDIDQSFYNPNDMRLEGTYMFPVPKGAQIDKFSMEIDGKLTDAELLDAEKARSIYEDIVRRMKDPALLEYAGQSLFKLRIFPIEPRSEKKIRLKYTQILTRDGNLTQYLYPLNTEKFSAAPIESVSLKVELESKQPLKNVYSPSHSVEVSRHGDRSATVGFEEKNVKPDTDFQLFFSSEEKDEVGLNLLTYSDSRSDDGFFLMLASPPASAAEQSVIKKDLVFVFDTSGSMAERGKIDQAKRAIKFCLNNLNTGDRFNIVRFSTEAELYNENLVDSGRENISKAEDFIDGLKPNGGTAIEDALVKAANLASQKGSKERPFMIVFLTDGLPTVGATNEEEIVKKVSSKFGDRTLRIFSFGVGTDVNTHLLDRLAESTRGTSNYVLPKEDLEVKLSSFYGKIDTPVLAEPKLNISGAVTLSKLQPSQLPDLFKGEQIVLLGRYKGSGRARLSVEETVNGERRNYDYDADFPAVANDYDFVPRLWATRRVGYLLEQVRLHGEDKELKDEIIEIARRYGIITPYTAYLIVEDESRREVAPGGRTLQFMDRDRELQTHARGMYEETQQEKSGAAAVGGSKALSKLSSADSVAAPVESNKFAFIGQRDRETPSSEGFEQALAGQEQRFIRGRNFYKNGKLWIDASIQSRPDARRVQIKFSSTEYFDFLKKHKDASAWLSLGQNVQVLVEDVVYEISGESLQAG